MDEQIRPGLHKETSRIRTAINFGGFLTTHPQTLSHAHAGLTHDTPQGTHQEIPQGTLLEVPKGSPRRRPRMDKCMVWCGRRATGACIHPGDPPGDRPGDESPPEKEAPVYVPLVPRVLGVGHVWYVDDCNTRSLCNSPMNASVRDLANPSIFSISSTCRRCIFSRSAFASKMSGERV